MPQKVRDDTFHFLTAPGQISSTIYAPIIIWKPAIIFEITVPLISGLAVFIRCSI